MGIPKSEWPDYALRAYGRHASNLFSPETRMAAIATENVAKFSRKTPAERFQYMVDRGLINQQGEVTFRDDAAQEGPAMQNKNLSVYLMLAQAYGIALTTQPK